MAERLDGTVALITGASSGIGAAVALAARREARLEQLSEEISMTAALAEHSGMYSGFAESAQYCVRVRVCRHCQGLRC